MARRVPKHKYMLLRTQNNDLESRDTANQTFGYGCKLKVLSPKIWLLKSRVVLV